MNWYKIKRDPADKLFSEYIRKRDGRCVRCGKKEGLQCSHFWGRAREITRFDTINCDCLCGSCHARWEHQKEIHINGDLVMGEYALWKLEQLGQKKYDALKIKAHRFKKKDRKMDMIIIKKLIDEKR
jgi:hypothetical protein